MGLKYLYLDESGDLGFSKGSSKFMVISALMVADYRELDRIIKNMRRNKFKKELRNASEIKANKSSSELKKYMINKLNEVPETFGFHTILDKDRLYSPYLRQNKDKLYNYIGGILAENIVIDRFDIEIRIDKSKGKQVLRDDFNKYFVKRLREGSTIGKLEIYHSGSESFSGLQFADLLAWSVYQKYSRGNNECTDLFTFNNSCDLFPHK